MGLDGPIPNIPPGAGETAPVAISRELDHAPWRPRAPAVPRPLAARLTMAERAGSNYCMGATITGHRACSRPPNVPLVAEA